MIQEIFNEGDRVNIHTHDFLSDGSILKPVNSPFEEHPIGYVVKLDCKAPNEYAWETDKVFMFPSDLKLIDGE